MWKLLLEKKELNMNVKALYIGGKLYEGSQPYEIINPATQAVVAQIKGASEHDALVALECAKNAYLSWSNSAVSERVGWMKKLRNAIADREEELRMAVHLEMGKPWGSTHGDFSMLVDSLNYYIELIQNKELIDSSQSKPDYSHIIMRKPIGVVASFLAWNFPLLNIAYKLGPAMASGCPIVIKPSQVTSLSATVIGEICADVGLPNGVVNIVAGNDQEIGDAISSSDIPALIGLIGSVEVGRHVIKTGASSIKRYSMELGGNAPVLVFPDADLALAASIVADMKTENAGQICVTPNRVFVHQDVYEEFIDLVKSKLQQKTVGFDKTRDIDMGPLMHMNAWLRVDSMVNDAVKKGAKLLLGGGRPKGLDIGPYYAPTLLSGVTEEMRVYKEEVFGPIVSVIPFESTQRVIAQANSTDVGLSSFVFTNDATLATSVAEQLEFGEVHVNGICYEINLPHCGIKQSGNGVDCSEHALNEYYTIKRISTSLNNA